MTDIKRVGVLGCGLMGGGIARVAATAGYDTMVRDVSQQVWDKARAAIERSLAKFVEKGKLPAADGDAAVKRLRCTTATAEFKGCDIVLEAGTEALDLKNTLWKELDGLCPPATIFASNTSSLTIAAMAAATRRADRFVGLHFFNPVPLMPLVEVVRTVTTSPDTFQRSFAFARSLGKEPVAAKDNSGFIVNLLSSPICSTPFGRWSAAWGACRTSTRRCSSAAAIRWARSPYSISWGSTRPTRSPRSCSPSIASSAMRRRRS